MLNAIEPLNNGNVSILIFQPYHICMTNCFILTCLKEISNIEINAQHVRCEVVLEPV